MKPRVLVTLIVFLFYAQLGISQEVKIEKEERIVISEVPAQSIAWLNSVFTENAKVKWYKETNSGYGSYEAKFKYQGKQYSVEFSENGDFEDAEFLVKWKSLDDNLQNQLLSLLSNFEKIKVKRFQKQWTSPSKDLIKKAIQNDNPEGIIEQYEIVFQGIVDGKHHIWEALLSTTELLSITEVQLRSTANLDF